MVKKNLPPEVLEFFRKQGARGGKIGGKRSLETMTPEARAERAKKAAAAAVAVRTRNARAAVAEHRKYGDFLLSGDFSGALDGWTELLHLKRHRDGRVTLSSLGHEFLAETREYCDEDGNLTLPKKIDGKRVWGTDGDAVLGERLVLHDDDATITLAPGEIEEALTWLSGRGWARQQGFEAAKREVIAAFNA